MATTTRRKSAGQSGAPFRAARKLSISLAVEDAEWAVGEARARRLSLSALARLAGEAMARVRGATLADAIVMASAARRGDRVLTGDVRDFEKLGAYFPSVKVLGI